jgi:hypothetical protein
MRYLQNKRKKEVEKEQAERENIQVVCPRADKCIAYCEHKTPHSHSRFCGDIYEDVSNTAKDNCPSCVEVEKDLVFFEEDFEIL